jgi:hypothetical protein
MVYHESRILVNNYSHIGVLHHAEISMQEKTVYLIRNLRYLRPLYTSVIGSTTTLVNYIDPIAFVSLSHILGKAAALEVEGKIVEGSPAWSLA